MSDVDRWIMDFWHWQKVIPIPWMEMGFWPSLYVTAIGIFVIPIIVVAAIEKIQEMMK